jgi:hypothetical protein
MHPIQELSATAREFRHLQAEHEREGPEGSWRRRQGARLAEIERHFETLLERWVDDPAELERWRAHFYHGGEQPEVEDLGVLLFKGRSDAGSLVEIRETESGESAVRIDATEAAHWTGDLPIESPLRFGDSVFEETFDAPAAAVEALRALVGGASREPPWQWATALYADGIIDSTFALTERGRRLLAAARTRTEIA